MPSKLSPDLRIRIAEFAGHVTMSCSPVGVFSASALTIPTDEPLIFMHVNSPMGPPSKVLWTMSLYAPCERLMTSANAWPVRVIFCVCTIDDTLLSTYSFVAASCWSTGSLTLVILFMFMSRVLCVIALCVIWLVLMKLSDRNAVVSK